MSSRAQPGGASAPTHYDLMQVTGQVAVLWPQASPGPGSVPRELLAQLFTH